MTGSAIPKAMSCCARGSDGPAEMRASNVIARLGGDEFALLLPDAGEEAGGERSPACKTA